MSKEFDYKQRPFENSPEEIERKWNKAFGKTETDKKKKNEKKK